MQGFPEARGPKECGEAGADVMAPASVERCFAACRDSIATASTGL
jgi:hypothetical protein